MRGNVVIAGFMGTGKTEVARELASRLGMKYVSVDGVIEEREKRTIREIFDRQGEPYFRKAEKKAVLDVSGLSGQVIDTGGGVVLDEENIENLKKNGIIVCLWAMPGTIYKRTMKDAVRPLLNVKDPMSRIKELIEAREHFYRKADLHVKTDGMSVKQVAEKIKRMLDEAEKRPRS